MISHSDTVQTLTLGLAFVALFIGSIASLPTTTENVLSITHADTSSSGDFGVSSLTNFTPVALAAAPSVDDALKQAVTQIKTGDKEAGVNKTPKEIHQQAQTRAKTANGDTPLMTSTDKREILWLARIMYSETKRADEQRLIGWVVRNRVDTGYTGRTYEDVAKHSRQFSGLHPYDNRYEHNISRWYSSEGVAWETALELAKEIYFAPESERPLAMTTRHFYSPHAVARTPNWAKNQEAVQVIKDPQTDQVRFALYDKIR